MRRPGVPGRTGRTLSWAGWTTYTSAPTNFTTGNGSITAGYIKIGRLVTVRINVVLGSTSSMGTGPEFSLPFAALTGPEQGIGVKMYDTSTAFNYVGWGYILSGASTVGLAAHGAGTVAASVPFTWANTDSIVVQGSYEAAN